MIDLALTALLLGLASAGIVRVVRALPWIQKWMLAGVKPWACDVCMTFWVLLGLCVGFRPEPLAGLAAYVVGLWVLGKVAEPTRPPPFFPEE